MNQLSKSSVLLIVLEICDLIPLLKCLFLLLFVKQFPDLNLQILCLSILHTIWISRVLPMVGFVVGSIVPLNSVCVALAH